MTEAFELGDITICLTRKRVKNVHLTVHPPDGRVTLVAPPATRTEVARAYAVSRLRWIRQQQQRFREQQREQPRQFVTRESHHVWGRRYLMNIIEIDAKPHVMLDHRQIRLFVRPGADQTKRAETIHEWHKTLLHAELPRVISKWERTLSVKVNGYYLQRMKTKWGSCNHTAGNIRLNTELVKKPRDLLEYVVVHEMLHLLEPTHNGRFIELLEQHWPQWREARAELNALPLAG
ncbi:M48 family metallopeptidase [Hydrogenophaga atypica]|uniref:M48 family metallopeptidase n=1 Tax=Hydrogenophaga atypica TaxID=249409 RepID=A0ABW2QR40_9BURK